jgi:signal transduction histidine kinase
MLAAVAAIALAAGRLSPLSGRIVAVSITIGFFGALAFSVRHPSFSGVLSEASGIFFTYIAAFSLGRLRAEQRRTTALLAEVLAGRDAQVRAAALDERAHLAREMHDVLAHTLSALSIQLEGAWLLAQQRGGDATVVHTLERASRLAKEGLLEAREAVSSLRDEATPGPDLLPALVDAFRHDSGTPATLEIEGEPCELPAEVRLTLYRTAQEALTNILKHAEATAMTMTLRYGMHDVELCIENQGRPRLTPAAQGGGYGLIGLGERAALLGGHLDFGPLPDGFYVRVRIPL